MREKLVEVTGLTQAYRRTPVLKQINFVLQPGDRVLLQGPNGSGKTTLLNTLCGRLFYLHGQIKTSNDFLGWSAYLPNQGFYLELSIRENYQFYADLLGLASPLLDEMAHKLDLGDFYDQAFGQLSTGQRARSLLGLSLLRSASVYLFDEPFLGLDSESTGRVMGLMEQLSREGKAILIASHGEQAQKLSTRQFWMDQGHLTER